MKYFINFLNINFILLPGMVLGWESNRYTLCVYNAKSTVQLIQTGLNVCHINTYFFVSV